jgi:hypothetical protein
VPAHFILPKLKHGTNLFLATVCVWVQRAAMQSAELQNIKGRSILEITVRRIKRTDIIEQGKSASY